MNPSHACLLVCTLSVEVTVALTCEGEAEGVVHVLIYEALVRVAAQTPELSLVWCPPDLVLRILLPPASNNMAIKMSPMPW